MRNRLVQAQLVDDALLLRVSARPETNVEEANASVASEADEEGEGAYDGEARQPGEEGKGERSYSPHST